MRCIGLLCVLLAVDGMLHESALYFVHPLLHAAVVLSKHLLYALSVHVQRRLVLLQSPGVLGALAEHEPLDLRTALHTLAVH